MAGMGPPPKDPSTRQRRNKVTTRAVLEVPASTAVTLPAPAAPASSSAAIAPALPDRDCSFCDLFTTRPRKGKRSRKRKAPEICRVCSGSRIMPWHSLTLAWWGLVWVSPMAKQYLPTDIAGGLFLLASLYERYHRTYDLDAAREIRLQESRMGLDIMARRRLQWSVAQPEEDEDAAPPPAPAPPPPGDDPRKVLFMTEARANRA